MPGLTSLRERVVSEALKQKELHAGGQPIRQTDRRYARLSGAVIFLVCSIGTSLIVQVSRHSGYLFIFATLFFAVLAIGGLLQLVTGRHLLTRR